MNICYLILAHNNFEHLSRLIDALNDDNSYFCVHLDKKAKGSYRATYPNVKIISQHIDIEWGGFGMIEATIALMRSGLQHFPNANYYALISGVDYPIRSKDFLLRQLESGKEFIDILPVPLPHKPIERFEYYYLEYNKRNPHKYNPKRMIEKFLRKRLNYKRNISFQVYAGAQWFVLTAECVKYIDKTIKKDKSYIRFFRHTLIPDEAFFQTIIAHSPFFNNTTRCLTYTDWSVPVPPAIIKDKHVDLLRVRQSFTDEYGQHYPFFARKFDDNSEPVLKKIREELWNSETQREERSDNKSRT